MPICLARPGLAQAAVRAWVGLEVTGPDREMGRERSRRRLGQAGWGGITRNTQT